MRLEFHTLLSLVSLMVGCGGDMAPMSEVARSVKSEAAAPAPAAGETELFVDSAGRADQDDPAKSAATPRKIIYTANVDLIVVDFGKIEQEIPRLAQQFGGYIAQQDLSGLSGSQRRGTWTVRVPVEKFDAFLDAVVALGEPQQTRRDSKDVTEQFFDIEARLRNKKVEEQRLLKLLEERTGKLEDVLAVEKELSRVRGEAEQMEGTLRMLANLTSLTTVTIKATELRDYKPPAAPTFGTTLARTFQNSLQSLVNFGKAIVLVVVALAPWMPVVAIVGLGIWWIVRAATRRRRPPPLTPASDAFLPSR